MHLFRSRQFSFSNLCKSVFICGCWLLTLCATQQVFAQRGGKAEPNRIEFKRGTTSTTINGVVHGDEQAEYVLAAKKGQRLIIRLSDTPAKSSCFDLKGPDGVDVGLEFDCNWNYSKPLPATGDYFISVGRTSQGKGTSRYKTIITIR
jgi:hypothetical protein